MIKKYIHLPKHQILPKINKLNKTTKGKRIIFPSSAVGHSAGYALQIGIVKSATGELLP
jgi:hypothetical protein